LEVEGQSRTLGEWRKQFLITSPGESLVYLTDFRVEPGSSEWEDLIAWIQGADTLICESQYLEQDQSLARKNGHMTALEVGLLGAEAEVGLLELFHLSRRYGREGWKEQLAEATNQFSRVRFPVNWSL
ncbi:MAG: ribonuclease Z, partial [Verrucomicrobiota bacterium]